MEDNLQTQPGGLALTNRLLSPVVSRIEVELSNSGGVTPKAKLVPLGTWGAPHSRPPRGQKIVSVLLFEDLLIVPLLALVAVLSPVHVDHGSSSRWVGFGIGVASLAGLMPVTTTDWPPSVCA